MGESSSIAGDGSSFLTRRAGELRAARAKLAEDAARLKEEARQLKRRRGHIAKKPKPRNKVPAESPPAGDQPVSQNADVGAVALPPRPGTPMQPPAAKVPPPLPGASPKTEEPGAPETPSVLPPRPGIAEPSVEADIEIESTAEGAKALPPRPDFKAPALPPRPAAAPARPGESKAAPLRPGALPSATPLVAAKSQVDSADTATDENPDDVREPGLLLTWFRSSPAWLTSMVVHAALILILALVGLGLEKREAVRDLFISQTDVTEQLEDPQGDPEQKEDLQTDVTVDNEVAQTSEAAPVDFKVDAAYEVPTNHEDQELAAAKITIDPLATAAVTSGDLLSEISGSSSTGHLGGRTAAGRKAGARRKGGNGASEAAVEAALKWIAAHQNPDGSWDYNHQPGGKCQCANPGGAKGTFGATGLALLPFLSAGYTHKEGAYKKTVEKGLNHLVGNMKVDAAKGTGQMMDPAHAGMYAHGLATIALTEAYGMTRDPKLKAPAQAALNWIIASQSEGQNFWGYHGGGGDTSVSGWQIMALKSGYLAYLNVPPLTIERVKKGLDRVQTDSGAYYGYNGPGKGPATTAIGLLSRMYLGAAQNNPAMAQGMTFIARKGPDLSNMYYTYYANQAMFQYTNGEGPQWQQWNVPMRDSLIKSQATVGHESGSWSHGAHVGQGGRLYSTSLSCMSLEVYYRYVGIYQRGVGHAAPGGGGMSRGAAVQPPAAGEDDFPTE